MDSSQQSIPSPSGHAHDHRSASRRSLSIALALIMVYMVVEVVGGLISGSLALLADAGHMLTDGAAIGLALLAIWVSGRPASIEQTFGFHRTEILAAMLNALSLWLISALIFFEASRRFNDDLQVDGGLMLGVGAVGLLVGRESERGGCIPARGRRPSGIGGGGGWGNIGARLRVEYR